MSAIQKYIRRGNTEKAMWFSLKLLYEAPSAVWSRLFTISVEDCGQPNAILVCRSLYGLYMRKKAKQKKGELPTREMCMYVVCCAKILSDSPKDRRADEFLELDDVIKKHGNLDVVKNKVEELDTLDDFVYDMHTAKGKKLGRGKKYWYETSSECSNKTDDYVKWREWFKPLMLEVNSDD